jgi:NRAMP (natural resistance-associated macrophage protein)-like metal ion transporter
LEQKLITPNMQGTRPLVLHPARPSVRGALAGWQERTGQQLRQLRKTRLVKYFAVVSFLGPGLIATTAGNDVGGIVTYASVGAQYGFGLLWAMVIITVSMAVVQEMCARMGAATGQGLSDLIRERFGVRGAAFAMLTLFVANALVTLSEFAGIAAVSEMFGIPRFLTVPVAAAAVWLLVTRGSYARVEKVFLAMTFAFLAYPIAAILARPDWGAVLRQTVIPTVHLNATFLLLIVGTIGTTITPYMQLYVQSAVAEKGIGMADYARERADTYFGAIFSDLISSFIIIATGATVFVASQGAGVEISTARQAAEALTPFVGDFAPVLFGIGLLGAALLASAVLPLTTAYAITESFGFERGISHSFREAPVFNGIFTGMIAFGALVALIVPNSFVIQLMVLVQVINGVLLPILLVYILKLVNDRRIMGKFVNSRLENMIAWGTTIVLSLLSAILVATTLLPIFGVQIPA